jgi:hypothetical protein
VKTRGVIGKRIVEVVQERIAATRLYPAYTHVYALVLEDGTRLEPRTVETDTGEYGCHVSVRRIAR